MGEGIAETGSDRHLEVPDSCGGLPHTRIFGIFVKFFSPKSEGMSKPRKCRTIQVFLNRNLCPIVYLCDAALN